MDEKEFLQKQLDEAKNEVKGIYELIDKRFGEVCTTIRELVTEIKTQYQTKEMCRECGGARDRKIEALEKKLDRYQWAMLVGILYVLYDLLKPLK